MKKITLLLVCLSGLYGKEISGFEHFKAPGITGGYLDTWSPFGMTDKGFDFSVGFYLEGGSESRPSNFWIDKKTKIQIEIDSISAINSVLGDVTRDNDSESKGLNDHAVRMARVFLSIHTARNGRSGLALIFSTREKCDEVITRLRNAGLDEATGKLLTKLAEESILNANVASKEFDAIWYEVDKLGGIEKVTVRGGLEPIKVISVLREAIFDAGKVRQDILKGENIVSPLIQ